MYTVCPKCALPLAVTAADLRAGQGYVRCGRCANVFNALLRLSEESALAAAEAEDADSTPYIEEMAKASATVSRPALPEGTPVQPPAPPPAAEAPRPKRPAYLEPDFYDPESTNPKIGMAPLKLVPPPEERAEASPSLRLMDSPPRDRAPELILEELPDEPAEEPIEEEEFEPVDLPIEAREEETPQAIEDEQPIAKIEADAIGERESAEEAADSASEAETLDGKDVDELIDEDSSEKYRGTGTFETIVLEGDTFLQTEETIPEEVLASEIANVSRRLAEAHNTAEFAALMESHFEDELEEASDSEERTPSESEEDPAPELEALREATGEFRRGAKPIGISDDPAEWFAAVTGLGDWRMISAAGVLGILLIFQAINHWRDDLATRAGWFGPMRSLASLLGEPLRPNWNLNAYDVRQLGASAEPPDNKVLKVRLSLTNVGARTQALPLIRLTLRDRYGKAVSRGELNPEQYLPAPERNLVMIRRDQRIDTELRVMDPSRQATSFELDVCVAASGGGLRCAGDAPGLAARAP